MESEFFQRPAVVESAPIQDTEVPSGVESTVLRFRAGKTVSCLGKGSSNATEWILKEELS